MVDPASMLTGRTRETKIHRDARGRWFNDGVQITHPLLTQAFDRWLVPAPDDSGRWCLSNKINWAYVSLDGPPRFVRALSIEDSGQVQLRLSDGTEAPLDPASVRLGADGALRCEVTGMTARFDRHAMMQLEPLIGEDAEGVFLRIGETRVRPQAAEEGA